MKAALFFIMAAVIGMFLLTGGYGMPAEAAPSPPPSEAPPETGTAEPAPSKSAGTESVQAPGGDDCLITVSLGGQNVELTMRDYLIGALSAEMPASFEPEALRAQAVAARTYALHKASVGCAAHPDAAVCGDSSCCAAYQSPSELAEKWGFDFYVNLNAIENAVDSTAGLCLVWEGEPILAVFHASSSGETESCAAVWGTGLPYLISVESPESEGVDSCAEVSWSDFIETVTEKHPEAVFGESRSDWLRIAEKSQSGRVASVEAGGVTMTGMEFRFLFGLKSTDFEFAATDEGLVFTVSGYGHGVGMSQSGAEAMAENGSDFSAILGHYYPGTTLVTLAISDILG